MTHMFDMRCQENSIEHRLTKVKHPWTNGQVERMKRTIKEATVRYHYDQCEPAYNYDRRLKTLKGPLLRIHTSANSGLLSQSDSNSPLLQMPGLNTNFVVLNLRLCRSE